MVWGVKVTDVNECSPVFPKGMMEKKGTVHYSEAILTQRIVDFAEDNLAKLIFNAKFLISHHPQNLIGGSVGGV